MRAACVYAVVPYFAYGEGICAPGYLCDFFLNTWLLKLECDPFDWHTQNHLKLPSTAFDDQHEQLSARCKTYMFYCAGG